MTIDPSHVRVSGPLALFSTGFAVELARQGYTSASICRQLGLMAHLSRWLYAQDLSAENLDASLMDRFLLARRTAGYKSFPSINALRPLLAFLRRHDVVPDSVTNVATSPVDVILERFHHYLTVERALSCETARTYISAVRPFVKRTASTDIFELNCARITTADVVSFVMVGSSGQTGGSARRKARALRSLLGFLHLEGLIEGTMIAAVPTISHRQLAGLPKGLDSNHVQRLLASCDTNTRNGARDLAVLKVLIRLGLRISEVAKIQLDDIDWRAGEIVIRGKANCTDRLPLPVDVGDAIAEYLRCGRPSTAQGRTVFVRVKAPHHGLSAQGVAQIVCAAAHRVGLEGIHAHRLRHTAATRMLHAGASLQEIAQVLRHRHILTTAIYAKVDSNALRTIARTWPGGAA